MAVALCMINFTSQLCSLPALVLLRASLAADSNLHVQLADGARQDPLQPALKLSGGVHVARCVPATLSPSQISQALHIVTPSLCLQLADGARQDPLQPALNMAEACKWLFVSPATLRPALRTANALLRDFAASGSRAGTAAALRLLSLAPEEISSCTPEVSPSMFKSSVSVEPVQRCCCLPLRLGALEQAVQLPCAY